MTISNFERLSCDIVQRDMHWFGEPGPHMYIDKGKILSGLNTV